MWHSIMHLNSHGQSDWSHLTLLVITSCPTLTQGSRMDKQIKHPHYSHIWVPSQGERWQPAHISPPTLAQDRFGNDGASTGVVCLPDQTLNGSCPRLPPEPSRVRVPTALY